MVRQAVPSRFGTEKRMRSTELRPPSSTRLLCRTQSYEAETGRPDVRQIRQGGPACTGAIQATFDLGYDEASNVTTRAETISGNSYGGTYTYGYDGANRLTNVTGPALFGSRTYGYDGGGNRTSVQIGTGNPVTTTYNGAGLPTASSDNTSYTHVAIGDLTKIDRTGGTANDWNFKYDSWGNLKSAARKTTGTPDVSFIVDALDRTFSRTAGTTTAAYTYQGMGETLAKSVVGATTTTYARTPGGPLAQRVGTTTRYYLRDQHGDAVGWANTSSGLAGTALYDPWGQLLSGTGEMGTVAAEGSFRFQSDLTDALTGQVDMLTRMYEPTLGRFSSRDVLFGDSNDPVTLNQYVYGAVNPVTYTDPTGMRPECGDCTPEAEQAGIRVWAQAVARNAVEQALQAVRDALEEAIALPSAPAVETPKVESPVESSEVIKHDPCGFLRGATGGDSLDWSWASSICVVEQQVIVFVPSCSYDGCVLLPTTTTFARSLNPPAGDSGDSGDTEGRDLPSVLRAPDRIFKKYLEKVERLAEEARGATKTPEETQQLLTEAERRGWVVERVDLTGSHNWPGGAHLDLRSPSGATLHFPIPLGF
jgi:RHS repeat-associated protein